VTVPIVVVLAAAKTSTGAPWVICAASVSEPPKDGTIFTPGCACSKFVANVVKVACNDDAANTTTVPDRLAGAGAAELAGALLAGALLGAVFFDELQPARLDATTTVVTRAVVTRDAWRFIDSPRSGKGRRLTDVRD
jgi:hypothetical protein